MTRWNPKPRNSLRAEFIEIAGRFAWRERIDRGRVDYKLTTSDFGGIVEYMPIGFLAPYGIRTRDDLSDWLDSLTIRQMTRLRRDLEREINMQRRLG